MAPCACRFSLYEPAEFIKVFLLDKLDFKKVKQSVAVHVPCSSKKAGISNTLTQLASLCAEEVVPTGVPCCGRLLSSYCRPTFIVTLNMCSYISMGSAGVQVLHAFVLGISFMCSNLWWAVSPICIF